jgi:hypothetical protein
VRGLSVALLALLGAGVGSAQRRRCTEPHYRWSAKVDTTLAAATPVATTVTAVLTTWEPLDLSARDRCAARRERELTLYGVTGWVRRVDKYKDDGDWHIELTERQDSPPDSCILGEIPSPRYGPVYARARASLDALLGPRALRWNTLVRKPRRVRVVGLAFFDGEHRRGATLDIGKRHGRCNASLRALWELHPVYAVTEVAP